MKRSCTRAYLNNVSQELVAMKISEQWPSDRFQIFFVSTFKAATTFKVTIALVFSIAVMQSDFTQQNDLRRSSLAKL